MTSTPEDELDQTGIAGLLSATYHYMLGQIISDLAAAGFGDLSRIQLYLLSRLDADGMSLGDVADRIHTHPQIASNLVTMLTENKYITYVDSHEVRATGIFLAERGREARKIVESSQRRVEQEWSQALGPDDYDQLQERLYRLFRTFTHTRRSRPTDT